MTLQRKITEISRQKRNPHRRSIFLDGEFAFGLDEEIVAKYDLKVGSEIDDDTILQILQKEEALKAKDAALNYLTFRPRSRKEVVDKLTEKGYDKKIIEETVHTLEEMGLVNDLEFSRAWVRDRLTSKPRGRRLIAQELRQKGIDPEIAEKAIEEAFQDINEEDLAVSLLGNRISRYRGLEERKAKKRMSDFLARRGFDWETVKGVIGNIWKESGENDLK